MKSHRLLLIMHLLFTAETFPGTEVSFGFKKKIHGFAWSSISHKLSVCVSLLSFEGRTDTNIIGREILTKYAISLIISLCINFPEGTRIQILSVKKSTKNRLHPSYLSVYLSILQRAVGLPQCRGAPRPNAQRVTAPSIPWNRCFSLNSYHNHSNQYWYVHIIYIVIHIFVKGDSGG